MKWCSIRNLEKYLGGSGIKSIRPNDISIRVSISYIDMFFLFLNILKVNH